MTALNPPSAPRAAEVLPAAEAEHSASTRRSYESAWKAWSSWADAHGVDTLPASPAAVAAYLTDRAEDCKMPTVRMAAAAIAAAHRASEHDNPVAHPAVKAVMKGLGHQAAEAGTAQPRQAGALTDDVLAVIRAHACTPRPHARGRMESAAHAQARGLVDIALCQVMADAGLRRSEAASLIWADVQREKDGSGLLLIRRSETDSQGEGAVVVITKRAMRDLAAIRQGADAGASVFGLSAVQINRRIKAAALAAGLGDGFGGHSGRVGLARRMVAKQAPLPTIMRQGRWTSSQMVARYTPNESAGAALRYL